MNLGLRIEKFENEIERLESTKCYAVKLCKGWESRYDL